MGAINGDARYWHVQKRELFVRWLDARADYKTPLTTMSANMHGMSAAFVCGEPGLDGLLGEEPRASIPPEHLDLFGIHSIDPLEKKLVHERRIAIADMRAIDEFGVAVLIRRVIEQIEARNGVLHLSFDLDVLDPGIAPGVGTTVPGGATYREAHLIMELLYDSGLIGSVDIVELNPFLDERGRTARVAVELIASLFGQQITDQPTPSTTLGGS
jgi:arginase